MTDCKSPERDFQWMATQFSKHWSALQLSLIVRKSCAQSSCGVQKGARRCTLPWAVHGQTVERRRSKHNCISSYISQIMYNCHWRKICLFWRQSCLIEIINTQITTQMTRAWGVAVSQPDEDNSLQGFWRGSLRGKPWSSPLRLPQGS